MNSRSYFTLCISVLFLWGCKKNTEERTYTISGKLLESSSNPVPVTGYKLTLLQNNILSFLGSYKGIEATATTNSEGRFTFTYSLSFGTGVATGSTNPNALYLTSYDTAQYKQLNPEYRPISVKVDTNLNTLYLYKKINKLVRKVNFTTTLNAWDTLDVITIDAYGAKYHKIYGPISTGTLLIVDTIADYKMTRIDLQSKKYTLLSVLKKPSFQKDLNIFLDLGDEDYREVLMTY